MKYEFQCEHCKLIISLPPIFQDFDDDHSTSIRYHAVHGTHIHNDVTYRLVPIERFEVIHEIPPQNTND